MCGHCSASRSGFESRCPLYSSYTSLRPDIPASQTTSVGFTPCSEMIFTSIEAKPKIAFVGCPFDVAIDSGSAKNARYTRLFPSIRNSSFGDSDGTVQPYRGCRPQPG